MSDPIESTLTKQLLAEMRAYVELMRTQLAHIEKFGESVAASGAIRGPSPPPPLHLLTNYLAHMRAEIEGIADVGNEMAASGAIRGPSPPPPLGSPIGYR